MIPDTAKWVVFVWLGLMGTAHGTEGPLYLGIVEQSPTHYVGEVSTTPFMVRAAFYREGDAWKAFPSMQVSRQVLNKDLLVFPERVNWTMAFDGNNLGQIHTMRPSQWKYYADVGFLQPDPAERVRLIPKEPGTFLYWMDTVYRPLVAVSKPNVSDPDHWKQITVPPAVIRRLIPHFRKDVSSAPFTCDGKNSPYENRLIVGRRSYRSASGTLLAQLALDDSAMPRCDGPLQTNAYASRWFYVQGNEIRLIDRGLEWIDAGDYDNNGSSEVIFHKGGYDIDGYVLLYGQLQKKAEFNWIYH